MSEDKTSTTPIELYNTLSGEKEEFEALYEDRVRMYNCGPTVYDFAHLGNLRSYVFADVLRAVLEYNGYEVKQVINITDVGHLTDADLGGSDEGEDKVEEGAKRENKTVQDIVEYFSNAFFNDLNNLNIATDEILFPKASDYISEQIDLIKILEERGYTYTTSDGVYFNTFLFPEYGKLGQINEEGMQEGARVEKNPEKKNPPDFALWKFSDPEEKRQQEWDSPWGRGYPGWHIECSAMAMSILGEQIDIHTGGVDHIPIHHNNEIAQSEAATSHPFAYYWLHNEFITIEDQKIAKSIGNTIHLFDLKENGIFPMSYRYWLLTGHYRKEMNLTWDILASAQAALLKIYRHFVEELPEEAGEPVESYDNAFLNYINDNLDTPKAIALLWSLIKDESITPSDKKATLLKMDNVLRLDLENAEEHLKAWAKESPAMKPEDAPDSVRDLVEKRQEARDDGQWNKADELRKQIADLGYRVEDTKNGSVLRKF